MNDSNNDGRNGFEPAVLSGRVSLCEDGLTRWRFWWLGLAGLAVLRVIV